MRNVTGVALAVVLGVWSGHARAADPEALVGALRDALPDDVAVDHGAMHDEGDGAVVEKLRLVRLGASLEVERQIGRASCRERV